MTNRPADLLGRLLVAAPLLSLALGAIAWLRYGIDIPWYDDWRGYAEGTIDSLEPSYLFRAMNDTLSPVGLALDALAQRYLSGNSIAYQFLSMVTVLGSLLLLQWKLLNRALGNTLYAAICFTFTLLMLQPGSYWGNENLAYYQALPLVFILWALLLMTTPAQASPWRGPAVALLGLLAGFTYISGAVGSFAAGMALLAVAGVCHSGEARRRLMRDATWFTAASAVAVAAQLYFSVLKFRGTHAGLPLALPTEAQFWALYLGKLARSLLLPQLLPWVSLGVTLLACTTAMIAAVLLLRRASSGSGTTEEKSVASVYIPLGALVAVYLALVAAGRTNFRPAEMQGFMEIFVHGFARFHFFWAALLWPWVVAALLVLCPRPWLGRAGSPWAAALAAFFAVLMSWGGGFTHMANQQYNGEARAAMANCLLRELQRGGEIHCEGLRPPASVRGRLPDSYPAYVYARKIGASFVRNFPMLPLGTRRDIAAFYRMDGNTAKPRMRNMEALGNGLFRATAGDAQLYIQTNQPQVTRRCTALDVEIEMRAAARDKLQLFYLPAGADSDVYSELSSVAAAVGVDAGAMQTLNFRLQSETGFFESLRLDPVTRPQDFEIREIRLYCAWEMH